MKIFDSNGSFMKITPVDVIVTGGREDGTVLSEGRVCGSGMASLWD